MKILTSTKHIHINYLFKNNYLNVYSRLTQILTPDELDLFALIKQNSYDSIWYGDKEFQFKSFSQASDDEKDIAGDILKELKPVIQEKINADKELENYKESILYVPSEENIFIGINSTTGHYKVKLTKWGCSSSSKKASFDSISQAMKRPSSSHSHVEVSIKFSSGKLAKNTKFYFVINNDIKEFSTNENGVRKLGLIKKESVFSISDNKNGPLDANKFIVDDRRIYEVTFSIYTDVKIKVINQYDEVLPNYSIKAKYSNGSKSITTSDDGNVEIPQVRIDANPLVLTDSKNEKITSNYNIIDGNNEFVFKIEESFLVASIIRILGKEDNLLVADYPFVVRIDDKDQNVISDKLGIVKSKDSQVDYSLVITDGLDTSNHQEFSVTRENHEFRFYVKRPIIEMVIIKFLDFDDKPIKETEIVVTIAGKEYKSKTSAEGVIRFEKKLFKDQKKIKVDILIKGKKHNTRKLNYKADQSEYIIKLKKLSWLWWLLLILPLLGLLFINLEKNVVVKVINEESGSVVPNNLVSMNYTGSFLYKNKSFLHKDFVDLQQRTDSNGITVFENLGYSFYSFVFRHATKFHITTDSLLCFGSTSLSEYIHWPYFKDTVILKLSETTINLDIKVDDSEDKDAINEAIVYLHYTKGDKEYQDSTKSNAAGMAVFENIPICSRLVVSGFKYGYFRDTIYSESIEELFGEISNRTLHLKPIKKGIEFFVVSCETNEPIPNAKVTIHIGGVNKQNDVSTITGKVRGLYDAIHIISKIKIDARKKYYDDGKLDSVYTVDEFIKLKKSERIICLKPKKNTIEFLTLDSLTKKPLAGVTNYIKVMVGKKKSRLDTLVSNSNGKFTVSDLSSDATISIESKFSPNYNPNARKIKNIDVVSLLNGASINRTILLVPKEIELTFWTKHIAADTLINNASLDVTIDGKRELRYIDSGTGQFTVRGYYNSTLSILANKNGYEVKNVITNKSFSILSKQKAINRIIPFYVCVDAESGNIAGQGYYIKEYKLSKKGQIYVFDYFTDSAPDEITVYDCSMSDIADQYKIFHINEATYDWKSTQLSCSGLYLTIVVNGTTAWDYKLKSCE